LGAGRTALFGNLIPLFSSMEAVWLLNESFSWLQIISGLIVIGGILLANLKK
jgi:drug/metabolite transporter (DMT)-like permease